MATMPLVIYLASFVISFVFSVLYAVRQRMDRYDDNGPWDDVKEYLTWGDVIKCLGVAIIPVTNSIVAVIGTVVVVIGTIAIALKPFWTMKVFSRKVVINLKKD